MKFKTKKDLISQYYAENNLVMTEAYMKYLEENKVFMSTENVTSRTYGELIIFDNEFEVKEVFPFKNKKQTKYIKGTYVPFRFKSMTKSQHNLFIAKKSIQEFISIYRNKKLTDLAKDIKRKNFKKNLSVLYNYATGNGPLRHVNDNPVEERNGIYSLKRDRRRHDNTKGTQTFNNAYDMFEENGEVFSNTKMNYFINLYYLKLLQYGKETKNLKDVITGEPLISNRKDFIGGMSYMNEDKTTSPQIHHIKVEGGASSLKENFNPSHLMKCKHLCDDKRFLKEMLGCIVLSSDMHDAIHKQTHSDIDMYLENDVAPFVLKSEENFNSLKHIIPLMNDLDYNTIINELRNT